MGTNMANVTARPSDQRSSVHPVAPPTIRSDASAFSIASKVSGVDPHVGIDEADDLTSRGPAACVSRGGDAALLGGDDAAPAQPRELRGAVGRRVVRDDDLDGRGTVARTACAASSTESSSRGRKRSSL